MWSPRRGSQSRPSQARRPAVWAALALGWVLPMTGCQVEYAGMTLPSGKYMHDDVQYFAPGTDFPWANTQAATQRARMQAMGMEVPPPGQGGPLMVPTPPGETPPAPLPAPNNQPPAPPVPAPPPAADGAAVPPPGGEMPAGAPGNP